MVMVSSHTSFKTLGMDFDPDAPYAGCRLCGAVYQSKLDRLSLNLALQGRIHSIYDPNSAETVYYGDQDAIEILDEANSRRDRWREVHTRRYHTEEQAHSLARTGLAFTPEAAYRLSPYGIFPLGNLHEEVVAALAEAPRVPEEESEGD
jgi:hypothetical protein